MAKTLAFFITWTTYGTWLQGDERGYVKNTKTYTGNTALRQANIEARSRDPVWLSAEQRRVIDKAIRKEASSRNHRIYAMTVERDHVHLIIKYMPGSIGTIVAYYKTAGRIVLKTVGYTGKLWTTGYDKRFCFDQQTLQKRIAYVRNHAT